jgi:hypothetical protein
MVLHRAVRMLGDAHVQADGDPCAASRVVQRSL